MRAGALALVLLVAACGSDAKPSPTTTLATATLVADAWIVERDISTAHATDDAERTCIRNVFRTFSAADLASFRDPNAHLSDEAHNQLVAGTDRCYG